MTTTHQHPASHLVQDFIEDDESIVKAAPQPLATLTFTQQLALDERQRLIERVHTLEAECNRRTASQSILEDALQHSSEMIADYARQLAEASKGHAMYEHVRTMTPVDFGCIWRRNVNGFGRFDDLILADMDKRKGQA